MQDLQPDKDGFMGFEIDGPNDDGNGASFVAMMLECFVVAEGGGATADLGL
jgi:hypothetical protein